jgi:uncharacterized 2Fe-2S/4Fe-4S cluster protein (DUF4445 family)
VQKYTVRFEPWGTVIACTPGLTLLNAARQADIAVGAVCGGNGTCGKCQVQILGGQAADPLSVERAVLAPEALAEGFRLACRYPVDRDLEVEILPVVTQGKNALPEMERAVGLAPAVTRRMAMPEPPDLARPVDDGSNLLSETGATWLDYRVAQSAPDVLRSARWRVAASVRGGEIIAVRPAEGAAPPLGLAIDLGTTNIAAYLYDLSEGVALGVFAAANPLASYGADILTRLVYAQQTPEHAQRLQRVLVRALNLLIAHGMGMLGHSPGDVEDVVIVGNTGMHHLLLGLPARHLVVSPYVAATRRAMDIKAREVGLAVAPGAYLHLPPLVGGFVGSDLLAVALATRPDRKLGVRLAVDIGTNTELLLSVDGRMMSCSTASGPALEGAALRFGSQAGPGVVDYVWFDGDRSAPRYRTIRGKPAIGICGSGIVSALSCMAQAGIINSGGRIQSGHRGVIEGSDGDRAFILVPEPDTALGGDLVISQHDVRAIQLAKGAIRGGIATLLAENNLTVDDLDEFMVAGAFGNHLEVESAVAIGLYPDIPRERIRLIGNAAGTGAALALLSTEERQEAVSLSERIHYLELARIRRFARLFAEAQRFPAMQAA